MRFNVGCGFGNKAVVLYEGGSEKDALRIDRDGEIPLVPIFPEMVGQHFCFICWEKEEPIFRGGPGYGSIPGYRGMPRFPERNVWRKIIFGRLSSVSWPDVPMAAWAVSMLSDREPAKFEEWPDGRQLASILKKREDFLFGDPNLLYLGSDSCTAAIENMLTYKGPIHVEPAVLAGIFLAAPDTGFPVPDIVQKELSKRLEKTAVECSSLRGKLERLAAEQKDTEDRIQELEELEAKLVRYGAA